MRKNILKLTKKDESQNLEFKSSLSAINRIVEEVCAFANATGGLLVIGISPDKKIKGVQIGKNSIEQLSNKITDNTDPPIYPNISVETVKGKSVIIIEVKASENKPHLAFGRAYKRVGNVTKLMSRDEQERLTLERRKVYFDEQICEGAMINDIDQDKLRWFLQTAEAKRNYPLDEDTPVKEALTHLNQLHDDKLTNASILLFGKSPQKFHLQAETKCMHFHGTAVEKPFETYHIYKRNVFEQVDNALGFVLDRLKRPVIPEPGKPTTKRPYEIPEFVIRESIVNAIAHRDYNSTAGVQVMVFADRIEVWNPGSLPPQLTLDSLKEPHPSIPHNPLIAESFYLTTYIEKAGSGTVEMIKQCREHGLLDIEFEEKMGCFVVTIWRSLLTDEYLDSLDLSVKQKKAVRYIEKNARITRAEYEKLYDVSERTANRELNSLVNKKLIEQKGKGPETYYVLARFGEIWRDKMRHQKSIKK